MSGLTLSYFPVMKKNSVCSLNAFQLLSVAVFLLAAFADGDGGKSDSKLSGDEQLWLCWLPRRAAERQVGEKERHYRTNRFARLRSWQLWQNRSWVVACLPFLSALQ